MATEEKDLTELTPAERSKRVASDVFSRVPNAAQHITDADVYTDKPTAYLTPAQKKNIAYLAAETAVSMNPIGGLAVGAKDITQGLLNNDKLQIAAGGIGMLPLVPGNLVKRALTGPRNAIKSRLSSTVDEVDEAAEAAEGLTQSDIQLQQPHVYSPEIRQHYALKYNKMSLEEAEEQLMQIPTARGAAAFVIENAADPAQKEILGRIMPLIPPDATFEVVQPGAIPSGPATAVHRGFAHGQHMVEMDAPDRTLVAGLKMTGQGVNPQTMTHELIHSATAATLRDGRLEYNAGTALARATSDLDGLFVDVAKQLQVLEKKKLPTGLPPIVTINTDELLAYGLTDPRFQDVLRSMTVTHEGQVMSAWTAFVRRLKRLLNLDDVNDDALSQLLIRSENLFDVDLRPGKGMNIQYKTRGLSQPDYPKITDSWELPGGAETMEDRISRGLVPPAIEKKYETWKRSQMTAEQLQDLAAEQAELQALLTEFSYE